MKKIICLLLTIIFLCSLVSCTTKQDAEIAERNFTPEPFELIIYEEDGSGYVCHKVLYNKETKVYHEYRYHYKHVPGYGYMTLDYIEFIVYDQNGMVISTEVQE